MMELIFWVTVAGILYTYAGYSLTILLLAQFVLRPIRRAAIEPRVTYLITAYNEAKNIQGKLEQVLSLDYPHDRLEIIVASDGSTDRTDDIVRQFADRRVRLVRVEGRVGKTETQNRAVREATGEVVIFSDATTFYEKSALRNIVRNYADPAVGAVSGRYEYRNPTGAPIGFGSILFWKYENLIKTLQTRIRTITGCCGCIYSVRRDLYEPLPADIISDLVEPLKILEKGYRIVFEPEAIAYEETTERTAEEFNMRVRVVTRGMRGLWYMRKLFNPMRFGFVSLQLLSHKVLRWLVPVLLLILLVSNLWLLDSSRFYVVTLTLQLIFYGIAMAGFLAERMNIAFKLLTVPLYFVTVNAAAVVAMYRILKGYKAVTWETVRR
ncbi:MAG TPA: glycosyltransferase family 2 protein [Bradyrhizobium sp.]|jgi:cellulose synthase/poly-beta-1,6-N-acetylglucosamine synthase-like glycosyltransferase|nr:glycosyltransferase family 2 protein [Bradyrhizobium sp.]